MALCLLIDPCSSPMCCFCDVGLFLVLCQPVYPLNGGCVTTWVRSISSGYTMGGGGWPKDRFWSLVKFTGKC